MKYLPIPLIFMFILLLNNSFGQSKGPRQYQDFGGLSKEHYYTNQLLIKWTSKGMVVRSASVQNDFSHIPALNQILGTYTLQKIEKISNYLPNSPQHTFKHKQWEMDRWDLLIFEDEIPVLQLIKELKSNEEWIELIEPSLKIKSLEWIPNDPLFVSQWHYHNLGIAGGTVDADIDLPEAWEIETGKPNIIVAVVDGGVDTKHVDLAQNLWSNESERYGYNFQTNTSIIEPNNHGCHVAGTIGAINNNGIGLCGVAGGDGTEESGVRILSCQIYSPTNASATTLAIASTFLYSADRGAAISNNSWGYTNPQRYYNTVILDGIDYFIENGGGPLDKGLVVFAAGNSNNDYGFYPADYERVISVMATLNTNLKASYSNYGYQVDISAPGGFTSSGATRGVYSLKPNNLYAYIHGTSMATPHVSGVLALLASYIQDKLSSDDLRSILLTQVDNLESINPSYTDKMGRGGLNAYKALYKAQELLAMEEVDPASNFTIEVSDCNKYQINWNKNDNNDTVLIAVSNKHKALFGIPNSSYEVGDSIAGGGWVIYKGLANEFEYHYTSEPTQYLGFKIWSKNEGHQYSKGVFKFINGIACDTLSTRIRYVKEGRNGNGSSWLNASGDLQDIINKSQWGDTIFVAKGTYIPNRSFNNPFSITENSRLNTFFIDKGITLLGGFPNDNDAAGLDHRNIIENETILSGDIGNINDTADNCFQVLHIAGKADSLLLIDGFTITAGNTLNSYVNYGAGLTNFGNATIKNLNIKKNYARIGAGIFNTGIINGQHLAVNENIAWQEGGAMMNHGEVILDSCQFLSNNALKGGVIYNNGIAKINHSTFRFNTAVTGAICYNNYQYFTNFSNYEYNNAQMGGFIYNNDSILINACNIKGNQATYGGSIYQKNGSSSIWNSIIDSNISLYGSVIILDTGSTEFINSNIVRNQIELDDTLNWMMIHSGTGIITNCILQRDWSNTVSNWLSSNWVVKHSYIDSLMVFDEDSTENWGLLFPMDGSEFIPEICSPLIDNGLMHSLPDSLIHDYRNQPRIQNGIIDIGAYEFSNFRIHENPGTQFIADINCLQNNGWNLHMFKDSNYVIAASPIETINPNNIEFKSHLLSSYGAGSNVELSHPTIDNLKFKCGNRGWSVDIHSLGVDSVRIKLLLSEKDLLDLNITDIADWNNIKILFNDSLNPWDEVGIQDKQLSLANYVSKNTYKLDTINQWVAIELMITSNCNLTLAREEYLPIYDTIILNGNIFDDKMVQLYWMIDDDEHIESYTLLKKDSLSDWHKIYEVEPDTLKPYTYNDLMTVEGTNYYQLQSIYKNGETSLSNIINFNFEKIIWEDFQLFPNPANREIFIRIKSPSADNKLFIFDALGKLVFIKDIKEKYQKLSIENLSPGIYFYQLKLIGKNHFGKLVIH